MVGARVVAVVPARGGSKSIPGKNIKRLAGHPLLAYSIAAAARSRWVARVIVSTDDPEIAEIAQRYGAEVPFMRPKHLAEDHVRDLPVFQHVLQWFHAHEGSLPEIWVQLRPTSPLRPPDMVDAAVMMLEQDRNADSVRSVVKARQTPYKMWCIEEGRLRPLLSSERDLVESYNMPRQELPTVYWQTGHIDVFRTRTIREKTSLTGDRVVPYLVPDAFCVDIDTEDDWTLAERVFQEGSLPLVAPLIPALEQ